MLLFRNAIKKDIEKISKIYDDIHTYEEENLIEVGWIRGVYPTIKTVENAFARQDLFVAEEDGKIVASAIINNRQAEGYEKGSWQYDAPENKIMVLHTLVVSPELSGKGYGKSFVDFYEQYALSKDCRYLRMDTNAKNIRARAMYKKLGYNEIGIVACDFNGIKEIQLILLEKKLS